MVRRKFCEMIYASLASNAQEKHSMMMMMMMMIMEMMEIMKEVMMKEVLISNRRKEEVRIRESSLEIRYQDNHRTPTSQCSTFSYLTLILAGMTSGDETRGRRVRADAE
eukprot:768801-Hanusia_phi.AAC.2